MVEFQEDKIFKNIAEEDVEVLLEITDKKSGTKKIWTKELRLIDPATFKPDFIIELDDENLIIEFQSTEINDKFSQRSHCYVAITDYKKENDKPVNLCVISTAEESKKVSYKVNNDNTFNYEIKGNDIFDGEKIIKEIEEKYKQGINIARKECIYFSLAPIMTKNGNIEENIEKTADILTKLNDIPPSTRRLCLGIEWLLVDKFIKNKELKNLLLYLLGDKMSAIYEYGELKKQDGIEQGLKEGMEKGIEKGMEKGMEKIIKNLYESGMNIKEISSKTKIDKKQIEKILN
ncbi:hypothetical protein [uncultured Methanobrevibacter sp.]|uniref:hypothetical protein n=1 Tax=uncultured Methanobrevibacter sp. TaxID=253161 RepID=UPI0025E55E16|nr:hypothetical protein [uncultured Methanobrevibacter sp.]